MRRPRPVSSSTPDAATGERYWQNTLRMCRSKRGEWHCMLSQAGPYVRTSYEPRSIQNRSRRMRACAGCHAPSSWPVRASHTGHSDAPAHRASPKTRRSARCHTRGSDLRSWNCRCAMRIHESPTTMGGSNRLSGRAPNRSRSRRPYSSAMRSASARTVTGTPEQTFTAP